MKLELVAVMKKEGYYFYLGCSTWVTDRVMLGAIFVLPSVIACDGGDDVGAVVVVVAAAVAAFVVAVETLFDLLEMALLVDHEPFVDCSLVGSNILKGDIGCSAAEIVEDADDDEVETVGFVVDLTGLVTDLLLAWADKGLSFLASDAAVVAELVDVGVASLA